MPGGPWYVSARAVRDYAELARLGDPDDEDVFAEAEEVLLELAEATVASGVQPRRAPTGALVYRVRVDAERLRRPGRGRPRIQLVVVDAPRPEGPMPQLVAVRPGD